MGLALRCGAGENVPSFITASEDSEDRLPICHRFVTQAAVQRGRWNEVAVLGRMLRVQAVDVALRLADQRLSLGPQGPDPRAICVSSMAQSCPPDLISTVTDTQLR
jgi:hypothetical protein